MRFLITISLIFVFNFNINAQRNNKNPNIESYIEQYKDIAVKEMLTHGIPASITLAQGILESSYGSSYLAQNSKNHFGIKCKTEWTGLRFYKIDEEGKSCYRKYTSVFESYEDHSLFLKSKPWYKPLFKLEVTDYKAWAYGLKKAGYATNPNYPSMLISIIKRYELHKYDNVEYISEL